jgi:hypothetical protein
MVCMHQIMEFCGRNSENSTGAYVRIEPSRDMVTIVDTKIRELMQGWSSDR